MITNDDIWLGSEASFYALRELLSKAPEQAPKLASAAAEEFPNPVKAEIVDGIAVMNVTGPMIPRATWLSRLFGITSYEDIQDAMLAVAGDKKVKALLLDYDTPGGYAKGCKQCAEFIRQYSDEVKPVYSHSSGVAASAGLWLYSAGSYHSIEEDAQAGSLGVILVHTEMSEMRQKLGIKDTVFRSAPYKALGTPFEKLSEKATDEIKESLEYLHNQFVTGISSLSDIPKEKVAKEIATGKVFRAAEAVKLGIADEVLPMADLLSKLAENHRTPAKT